MQQAVRAGLFHLRSRWWIAVPVRSHSWRRPHSAFGDSVYVERYACG